MRRMHRSKIMMLLRQNQRLACVTVRPSAAAVQIDHEVEPGGLLDRQMDDVCPL
jgi:hypothetical protein